MIRLLVMDVDGTLTDGKIYMGNSGELFKAFDIKDGCGIHDLLKPNGIEPVIITGRTSVILENRAKEIGIDCLFQGVTDKTTQLEQILHERNLELSNVAFIGDDINDIKCMQKVIAGGGVAACPYDAVDEVKEIVDYVCKRTGGNGAVRDFIGWILNQRMEDNLSQKIEKAIGYVQSQNPHSLPVGKYEMSDGSYFMVQEYITKKESNCRLESHRQFVDVQWILKGKEKIKTISVDKLDPEIEYNIKSDVAFWEPVRNMMEIVLHDGSYTVLYPNNAHMPCIAVEGQESIRKVVIKIKI